MSGFTEYPDDHRTLTKFHVFFDCDVIVLIWEDLFMNLMILIPVGNPLLQNTVNSFGWIAQKFACDL